MANDYLLGHPILFLVSEGGFPEYAIKEDSGKHINILLS
jgi:hypothetical protein